jgi:ribosomal protein S12 methylthiotransferase accessory factor
MKFENEHRAPGLAGVRCEGAKHETVEEDLEWVQQRLTENGITEWLVVDATDYRFGIPVIKVIVPGLETLPELGCPPGVRARHYHGAR